VEDAEMRERVERHKAERPTHWHTIEEPLNLAAAVRAAKRDSPVVLVDCLTVWLSNVMWEHREQSPAEIETAVYAAIDAFAEASTDADVFAVSNEVGSGVVPVSPAGRLFRDLQGLLNQRVAARADRVFLTIAGIAIPIKLNPYESRSSVFPHA
jgi:adenosylcobinamide kinase / adenosylcobinamide-phosphate guanylyltransferase